MAEESKTWSNVGKLLTVVTIIYTVVQLYIAYKDRYSVEARGVTFPFKIPNKNQTANDSANVLNKYTSLWYFVIENNGDKPLENLKLEVPMNGFYELVRPDSSSVGNFKKSINIGELNPSYSAVIYIWVTAENTTIDNFFESEFLDAKKENSRVTHKYGYAKVDFSQGVNDIFIVMVIGAIMMILLVAFIVLFITIHQKKVLLNKLLTLEEEIRALETRNISLLTDEMRENNIKKLKSLIPKNDFANQADKQWIFEKTCLVHDYTFKNQYKISIDTYCHEDGWEVQLFGRNIDSENYLFHTVVYSNLFLPEPINKYKRIGNRLIFKRLPSDESPENISHCIKDLLFRMESYRGKNS
jgi:hypothetical protein